MAVTFNLISVSEIVAFLCCFFVAISDFGSSFGMSEFICVPVIHCPNAWGLVVKVSVASLND
jgi:hypothetical protein